MRSLLRRSRRYRVLIIAIVLSTAIHFMLGPFLARWRMMSGVPDQLVAVSTSIRVDKRAKPVPHVFIKQSKPLPQSHPEAQHVRALRRQIVVPHIRPNPQGTPQPPVALRETQVAPKKVTAHERDQQLFEKAIAQAKTADDPLRVVPATPGAPKRYRMDLEGQQNPLRSGEGILTPTKSWHEGGYNYYYVDYLVVFSDGTRDEGACPWPIRYLPKDDPFVRHFEHFPLPGPMPGFQLPADYPMDEILRPYFPSLYPGG